MLRGLKISLIAAGLLVAVSSCSPMDEVKPVLVGFSVLASSTFEPGPTSGQFIDGTNGVAVPFDGQQPIQGFSAMLNLGDSRYLVISDNGFGGKKESPDHVLRFFEVAVDFDGGVEVLRSVSLRDPDSRAGFPIVAGMDTYPGSDPGLPVDPAIREQRLLTGYDIDVESIRQAPDGSYWLGDEFGPFLIHIDAGGRLLAAPVPLPGVQSPDNPDLGENEPTIGGSSGFEGMALSANGSRLYPMLEHHVTGDPARQLRIYEFDPARGRYVGDEPYRFYQLDSPDQGTTEFTAVSETKFLIIERDGLEGPEARFKKVFLVDFNVVNEAGYLVKKEVLDLLSIPDPDNVGGIGEVFTFPFVTTEALAVLDDRTIVICNDNNYPFSVGRHVKEGLPDDNEFILIRFDRPLSEIAIKHERPEGAHLTRS
jgi:hypothetical protein